MTQDKEIVWSDYVLYVDKDIVHIVEEKGNFVRNVLFELPIEEVLANKQDDRSRLVNVDERFTIFLGLTKAKNRLMLTHSKWGDKIEGTDNDYMPSTYTYFILSTETLLDLKERNFETEDGSLYRKSFFTFN